MYYQKVVSGETIIEFHNNWSGEETVIINGHIVSKKSSFNGTNHYFTVIEKGENVRYILTSRINSYLQIVLDLNKNGVIIQQDIIVGYGTRAKTPKNIYKKKGILKINEYELEDGINELNKALQINLEDAEIYFYLACAYSVLEKTKEGYECLRKAVEYNLQNTEMILNQNMMSI